MKAFNHVANVVFQIAKEEPLCKALEKSGDSDVRYMASLIDIDIVSLNYDKNSEVDKEFPLTRQDKSLHCTFHHYILHCNLGDQIWLVSITPDDFVSYQVSPDYGVTLAGSAPKPPATTAQQNPQQPSPWKCTQEDQALAQDIENLDPGHIARTKMKGLQADKIFLISSPCKNVVQTNPARKDILHLSNIMVLALSTVYWTLNHKILQLLFLKVIQTPAA